MEKPMSQRLHERFFGGSPNLGVAYPIAEPLPESATPIEHAENEQESRLIIDDINPPKERPALRSLVEIVGARLQSIKPKSKQRARQVAQMIADLQEPLESADEMYATLEAERVEDLQKTWDELQNQGRELKRRINNELQAAVNSSMMVWNAAEEKRGRAKARLQQAFESRRAVKLDRYSTQEQNKAAEAKYASALQAFEASKSEHVDAERAMAQAENEKTIAQSRLSNVEIAMDRVVAEIQGVKFHDPQTGLSVDPTSYLQQ
jgi:chromosome segregation ATPase